MAVAAVLVAAASYAQGTVNFANKNAITGLNAPVTLPDGSGVGGAYSAALYLVSGTTETIINSSLNTFRASPAAATGYLLPLNVTVPGVAGGQVANLKIKAWETSAGSYEAALAAGTGYGESLAFNVTLTDVPAPPADIPSTLQGFTVTVIPEPTTIALGALGAAVLLFRRRK